MPPARLLARIAVLSLSLLAAAWMAAPAGAAEAYTVAPYECGGRRGSGQGDGAGRLYLSCGYEDGAWRPHIRILEADGSRRQTIYLNFYATDVAPSPDGTFLYVVHDNNKQVYRLNRQPAGHYMIDGMWKLDAYQQWGTNYNPTGEFIATDAAGFVYFSSGTWTASPTSILKYSADGRLVTQFGTWDNSWANGIFYWMNTGLTVTPNGQSIYVAEVGNNRIQRFDRRADGSYGYSLKFGNDPALDNDPRGGLCEGRNARLAAPYDVGLDGAGNVYVLNTTCRQVKKFSADGNWLHTQQLPNPNGGWVHGLTVAANGTVYTPELNHVLRPGGAVDPGPGPVEPAPQWINDAHKGWAFATARVGAAAVPTWKWTAQGWVYMTFPHRTKIWAQPFAPTWMWAWRDGTWYAMRTADIAL